MPPTNPNAPSSGAPRQPRIGDEQPLVNEKVEPQQQQEPPKEPQSFEEALSALRDARDEVKRTMKFNASLSEDLKHLKGQVETLSKKSVSSAGATTGPGPIGTSTPATLIPPPGYDGPGLNEVYLAVLTGLITAGEPKTDQATQDKARSAVGMAEVFFSKLLARPSFRRPE